MMHCVTRQSSFPDRASASGILITTHSPLAVVLPVRQCSIDCILKMETIILS